MTKSRQAMKKTEENLMMIGRNSHKFSETQASLISIFYPLNVCLRFRKTDLQFVEKILKRTILIQMQLHRLV